MKNVYSYICLMALAVFLVSSYSFVRGQSDLSISANYPSSVVPLGTFNMNVIIVNSASAKDGALLLWHTDQGQVNL
jgi:hypothetical protein